MEAAWGGRIPESGEAAKVDSSRRTYIAELVHWQNPVPQRIVVPHPHQESHDHLRGA
jgi:hypothetical protein